MEIVARKKAKYMACDVLITPFTNGLFLVLSIRESIFLSTTWLIMAAAEAENQIPILPKKINS